MTVRSFSDARQMGDQTWRRTRHWPRRKAAYMPKGMVTVPFNPQLINTGSKLILVDTGNGIATLEPTKGAVGRHAAESRRRPASIPTASTSS